MGYVPGAVYGNVRWDSYSLIMWVRMSRTDFDSIKYRAVDNALKKENRSNITHVKRQDIEEFADYYFGRLHRSGDHRLQHYLLEGIYEGNAVHP